MGGGASKAAAIGAEREKAAREIAAAREAAAAQENRVDELQSQLESERARSAGLEIQLKQLEAANAARESDAAEFVRNYDTLRSLVSERPMERRSSSSSNSSMNGGKAAVYQQAPASSSYTSYAPSAVSVSKNVLSPGTSPIMAVSSSGSDHTR